MAVARPATEKNLLGGDWSRRPEILGGGDSYSPRTIAYVKGAQAILAYKRRAVGTVDRRKRPSAASSELGHHPLSAVSRAPGL